MKLKYLNIKDIKNDKRNTVHVNIELCHTEKEAKYVENTNKVHITINKEFMYLDTVACAKKISAINHQEIYLHTLEIPLRYKLYILQVIAKHMYTFDKYKSDKTHIKHVFIVDLESNKQQILRILQKIDTVVFSRDLANEPANIMTPQVFAEHIRKLFSVKKYNNVSIKVMTDTECKKEGLNLIHEMGKASTNKCRFLVAKYSHREPLKTFCLLGKGVTFDAGGLNMKTHDSMSYEMKTDKYGACVVTSLLRYAADIDMKCNIIALIPLIENLNSGNVVHPGDIIKCYNNKTVEVLNTDAEGRLILADSLAYSENYADKVDYILDFATLTGWTDFLHCDHSASYFTVNKHLHDLISNVGEEVGERTIGLPRWPEYKRYTASDVADYKNFDFTECAKPGGFMASVFLYNFVPDKLKNKWVHFDISNSTTDHCCNGNCTLLGIQLLERLLGKK